MIISAYCRVSTDSEQQEKSFEAQQSYFNREITARGHQLYKVYGDEGETGTKLNNRKQFNQMLFDAGIDIIETYRNDAPLNRFGNIDRRIKKQHLNFEESERTPLFNEIWIKNTSRFARNTFSFEIVEKLRNKGVHIYFIEQNINTKDLSADFLLKLFQLFDEQESRDKSSKVKWGLKENAKTKKTISTTRNIYGFNFIKETNSLEIIEEEAEVIRLIYKLYLEGNGIRRIINHLNDNQMYTRKNKPFCPSTIKRILSNEKYCGTNVRNKYTNGRIFNKFSYPHINDKSEWIVHEDHERIEPIISKDTFKAVQAKLKENTHHQTQKGIYKGISEYAGLIYCESCGQVYYSNVDRGRRFYNCRTKKQQGTIACNNPNISETKLDKEVTRLDLYIAEWKSIVKYKEMLKELEQMLSNQYSAADTEKGSVYANELKELKAKKDRYVEMYSDSLISKQELTSKVEPINIKIEELEYSISVSSKHNTEIASDILEVLEARTFLDNEDRRLKKEFMEDMQTHERSYFLKEIDRIVIMEDGKVDITYKITARLENLFSKYQKLYNELKKRQNIT
jgi:DNA invertase Pin-like site-specific DNA recombinase